MYSNIKLRLFNTPFLRAQQKGASENLQCKKVSRIRSNEEIGEGTRKRSPLKVANQLRALYLAHPLESRSIFLYCDSIGPSPIKLSFQQPPKTRCTVVKSIRGCSRHRNKTCTFHPLQIRIRSAWEINDNRPSIARQHQWDLPQCCQVTAHWVPGLDTHSSKQALVRGDCLQPKSCISSMFLAHPTKEQNKRRPCHPGLQNGKHEARTLLKLLLSSLPTMTMTTMTMSHDQFPGAAQAISPGMFECMTEQWRVHRSLRW